MKNSPSAIFLDRDGVLNRAIVIEGRPFPPRSLAELHILDHAVAGCALLKDAGYKLVCVTNQPDVARGLMSQRNLDEINDAIVSRLGLDALRTCPHSDEDQCRCRKPRPGMLIDVAFELGLNLAKSYMVGDRWRDVEAGISAGCQSIFIDHGYAERLPKNMVYSCLSLEKAARFILLNCPAQPAVIKSGTH